LKLRDTNKKKRKKREKTGKSQRDLERDKRHRWGNKRIKGKRELILTQFGRGEID